MGDLLIVGKTSINRVQESRTGRNHEFLGGSGYFAAISASFFTSPALLTKLGSDITHAQLDALTKRQIGLAYSESLNTPSVVWRARYDDLCAHVTLGWDNRGITDETIYDIPAALRDAKYIYIGEMHPKFQLGLIEKLDGKVLLDTKRPWVKDHTDELRAAVHRSSMIVMNEEEAGTVTGETDPSKMASNLRSLGPRIVIINLGTNGSIMFYEDKIVRMAAPINKKPFETTGAGDTFSGAFMGALASGRSEEDAFLYGQVMSSFVIEDFGARRMFTLIHEEIEKRFQSSRELLNVI